MKHQNWSWYNLRSESRACKLEVVLALYRLTIQEWFFASATNLTSEFVTEMSKNNRFRINGLSRDPGSMNFGTLLKRHPKFVPSRSQLNSFIISSIALFPCQRCPLDCSLGVNLTVMLFSYCFVSVTGTFHERFSSEAWGGMEGPKSKFHSYFVMPPYFFNSVNQLFHLSVGLT